MDSMNDRVIAGQGTAESDWLRWLPNQDITPTTAVEIFASNSRLVVVAPHPDDEILACGGLLALCARLQFPVLVVAITDGEASHGAVDKLVQVKLCQQRVRERCAGLIQLGIDPSCVLRLNIPDGQASLNGGVIFDRLLGLLRPGDLVITTWQLDGHPDHEATAQAVHRLPSASGAGMDVALGTTW